VAAAGHHQRDRRGDHPRAAERGGAPAAGPEPSLGQGVSRPRRGRCHGVRRVGCAHRLRPGPGGRHAGAPAAGRRKVRVERDPKQRSEQRGGAPMTVTELPRRVPGAALERASRWAPFRAGILNVWRYYDEEFEFHEGRLLLRGPNGTGKSKALELLLPFLFDASLRANRLSTFGTGERTMYWNLMGEGASGTTRVGYVWLEFRFPGGAAPGGSDRSFCCGARLQASTHTTNVHADYFTTGLRIGRPGGLSLLTGSGQPLTKSVLEERLGEHGT